MKIYVDGHPNEVCCVTEDGKVDRSKIGLLDHRENTNNIAEYHAILFGLYRHPEVTEICSDSNLAVRQLNGVYKIKKVELALLAVRIWTSVGANYQVYNGVYRLTAAGKVKFTFVKGHENPAGRILG